jgi:hypothetical protein
MDQKFRTSFIPKRSLSSASVKNPRRRGTVNLFFLGSLIIFLGAVLLAGGIFLYQEFLIKSIENKRVSLEKAREEFEPASILQISRLDTRLKSAEEILKKHLTLSALFNLLEKTTLKSVQFKEFNFEIGDDGRIAVFMKGEARSFSSIALQSDIFGKNKFIKEPIFSELNLNKQGNAVFDFTAFIDDNLLSYALQHSPAGQSSIGNDGDLDN